LIELAKDPKNSDLWNVVSQYADRQPAYGDSVYRSARKIIGANLATFDSEGFMIWGNIARKRRINNDARYFLEQSIKLKSDNVIAANNLANILYKEEPKDFQKALTLIEMVLRLEPNNPIYLETRGQILALLGEDDRAIDDLTRSLSSFPNVPEIHETLSRLLRRKGSIELALRHESRLTELRNNIPNQNQSGQLVPKPR
jgi:tetratricopeptide (TPR) repeat protein